VRALKRVATSVRSGVGTANGDLPSYSMVKLPALPWGEAGRESRPMWLAVSCSSVPHTPLCHHTLAPGAESSCNTFEVSSGSLSAQLTGPGSADKAVVALSAACISAQPLPHSLMPAQWCKQLTAALRKSSSMQATGAHQRAIANRCQRGSPSSSHIMQAQTSLQLMQLAAVTTGRTHAAVVTKNVAYGVGLADSRLATRQHTGS
jgi:hypothetical protein